MPTAKAKVNENTSENHAAGLFSTLTLNHITLNNIIIVNIKSTNPSNDAKSMSGLRTSQRYGRYSDTLIAAGARRIMLAKLPSRSPKS